VNLDAQILEAAQAADAFDEFFLLELVRRARHDLNLDPAGVGADQMLNDGGILVAFVLQPQGVLARVDEPAESLASVADAPDEMRVFTSVEFFSSPVGIEALRDLVDLMLMTLTPPWVSFLRVSAFSFSPSRRSGLSMTRTSTPRCWAARTASRSAGSEKRNILTRMDFLACAMASRIGLAVSSGRTMMERDIRFPSLTGWVRFDIRIAVDKSAQSYWNGARDRARNITSAVDEKLPCFYSRN
jgi:hypothetical protein